MDSSGFSQFTAGKIEPLDGYLNDPTKTAADYNLADFPNGFLTPGTYPPGDPSAKLYGIPISFETYILFYNKDLVNKYLGGKVPTTMDELTAAAAQITKDGQKDGVVGSVMRGIRSDAIMDTFSGVVYDSWGSKDAPPPYGLWFDGAWTKPRLTDPAICAGMTNYAKLVAAGPSNKFAIDWPDANTLFSQGKAAFFIDASLFGPSYEDTSKSQVAGKVVCATAAGQRRRQVVHRALALGPRHPVELQEQGRGVVLHPVDDQQGEHGHDRGNDRRRPARERVQ